MKKTKVKAALPKEPQSKDIVYCIWYPKGGRYHCYTSLDVLIAKLKRAGHTLDDIRIFRNE